MKYFLEEICHITDGKLIGRNNLTNNVLFDSRDTNRNINSVFVAINSQNRNGHNYIKDLIANGVHSFIVEEEFLQKSKDLFANYPQVGFVITKNSVDALQKLATHYRSSLNLPVYAIAGSNGKTITKEWIVQLLPSKNIFRSPKSFNSQIGVPISILMINGDEDFAIIEAGISKPNEMAHLEKIIKPNGVIFTNLNSAHQENFCSVSQRLDEKMMLCHNTEFVVYNSDKTDIDNYIKANFPQISTFNWGETKSDITVQKNRKAISLNFDNEHYKFSSPFQDYGSYENLMNALCFIAKLGLGLDKAISQVGSLEGVEMRLQLVNGINNCRIINDSYSNDIHSLTIALNYMNTVSPDQNHIVILSDFVQSRKEIYKEVNDLLRKYPISKIYTIGENSKKYLGELPFNHTAFGTTEEFCKAFSSNNFHECTVLIKGSRIFSFEKIATLLQEKMHSTVLDIDLDALIGNYKYIKSLLSPKTKTVAMVKALAYGSGTYEIASTLCEVGVDYFAVAYIDEGIALRQRGISRPIIILNASQRDFEQIYKYNLEPEIYSFSILEKFIQFLSARSSKQYAIHIKLDTGMNRLGFKAHQIDDLCKILSANKILRIASIFSHFSSADCPEQDDETYRQLANYDTMSSKLISTLSLKDTLRHIANSAGTKRFPQAHYDMVRMGISLYGIDETKELKNISSLKSTVLQIKEVKKGETIGYNQNGKIDTDSTIAIVSIGYADGLNRKLGNGNWKMKINGQLAPIIGNVSMDNCAVNITGLDVQEGDEVIVFNTKEDIIQMANIIGTIPYEILTSVSSRIKRRYFR